MDEGRRAEAVPIARARHDETIEDVLRAAIDARGPALLYAAGELKKVLHEGAPDAVRDIDLLLVAVEEQVPQALLGVYSDAERRTLTRRLEDQLYDRRALDWHTSAWAVATWARALRVDETTLLRPAADPRTRPPSKPITQSFDFFDQDITLPLSDRDPTRHGDVATPVWASDAATGATRFRHWYGVFGVLIAIAIVLVSVRGMMSRSPASSDRQPVVDAPAPVAASIATPTIATPVAESPPAPVAIPAKTEPSTITYIIAPAEVRTGERFALTIDYRVGTRAPVAIERRTVDGDPATNDAVVKSALADLSGGRPGKLTYPMEATAVAARNAFEFTLVDADGTRSEPKIVAIDVVRDGTRDAPKEASKEDTKDPSPGPTIACTPETCGTVASVRELDGRANGRYETVVRTDDRELRTVVAATRFAAGARVRLWGGTVTPLNRTPTTASSKPTPPTPSSSRIFGF